MDILSYELGKKAGGGGTPSLQSKSLTITENGTTNVTADEGYDGLSGVNITTDLVPADIGDYFDNNITADGRERGWTYLIKKMPTISISIIGANWSNMFQNYNGTNIPTLSSGNKPTKFENMFLNCVNLKNFVFSNIFLNVDTSMLTTTQGMFYGLYDIENFNLEGFDTSNVTNMVSMFYRFSYNGKTSNVKILDLSSLNTNNVTNMEGMFRESKMNEILFGTNFKTNNVFNFESLFYSCRAKKLDLSNWDFSKATKIYNMFSSVLTMPLEDLKFGYNLGKGYLTTASANNTDYTLNFSKCTYLTHDSLMSVINNLYDIASAGVQPQQLILGSTNLAKLDAATEVSIATNKGWTVS